MKKDRKSNRETEEKDEAGNPDRKRKYEVEIKKTGEWKRDRKQ